MRFGPLSAMLAAALIAAPAGAVPTLYGVTFSNTLNTIDTSTGASNFVGNLSTPMDPFDLSVYNGNLYTYDQLNVLTSNHGPIRQLDPATGATVNTFDIGIAPFGEGAMAINPATGVGLLVEATCKSDYLTSTPSSCLLR